MTDLLKNPIFNDETKAREWLEARVWPEGPTCPHCGNADEAKIKALEGKAHRPGLYQCAECREQFTVTVKTVFERSKIPLTKWLAALFLMTASKKGVSAHQVHRMLGISYKSTWFMMHRLREAMRTGGLEPLGGKGKVVEADETYFGSAESLHVSPQRKGRPYTKRGKIFNNRPILALVERGGDGSLVPCCRGRSGHRLRPSCARTWPAKAICTPTKASSTARAMMDVRRHKRVKHTAGEYVRGDVTTNTIESYFSIFKRGMRGTYQHCAEKHLHRYLAEFDFRHNNRIALGVNDTMRAENLAAGIVGKRLTYRRPNEA